MKYYYWANALIGVNPAANCVLFTTDEGTGIPTITQTVTGIEFSPDSGNIEPGETLQLYINLVGTLSADEGGTGIIAVEPDAALFSVSAVDGNGDAKQLNSRTYVDNYGILHCQKTDIEAGDVITVTATAAYINPSGATTTYTDDFTATVV